MKSTLTSIFHFLYWIWFVYFFFFIVDEIFKLSQTVIGEGILFMIVSTFGLFFVGLFLYLFTLTYEIPQKRNKLLRSASLVVCVILIVVFFVFLKNNSALRT